MTRVVIGAAVHNNAEHLPAAIESLLAQTYRDFRLVLLDDCSEDETPALARGYADADERVVFVRSDSRLGLNDSWRRVHDIARELFPSMEYFAWGSDHEHWHPKWLEKLVAELDGAPEAVAAYPECVRVTGTGELLKRGILFDTAGVTSPWRRLARTYLGIDAGNMVYGLFRSEALERAGVFRRVLGPDRLLLTELSLQGEFRQVRETLWERRFSSAGMPYDRPRSQRRRAGTGRAKCFPNGGPWYTRLPVAPVYVGAVFAAYVLRGEGRPALGRLRGLLLTSELTGLVAVRASRRRLRRAHKGLRSLRRSVDRRLRGRGLAVRQ